jgi:hypothetical protein
LDGAVTRGRCQTRMWIGMRIECMIVVGWDG